MSLLPNWIVAFCGCCALVAAVTSFVGIHLQLANYRKPLQQRLIVRIQLMIPLFALSCYISLRWSTVSKFIEPVREIYEAFVIYTFFTLLTYLLGGERNIVIMASGREPVSHPPPVSSILRPVDISDPVTLLAIKRGILQYVWLKPIICLLTTLAQIFGGGPSVYFAINFIYNISVTMSLYDLALFWKCLYRDLKPYNPWGKFLCVKLIIFASYWQGVILGILSFFGVLKNDKSSAENTLGFAIQNALMCVELIGFAIGHWHSFSWTEYSARTLPACARLSYVAALKDTFGCGDLVYDFVMTFEGASYDYRQFDSVEALIAHPSSASRMARFNDGLRFTDYGKQRYWLPKQTPTSPHIKTPLLAKPRSNSITSTTNASTRAMYANSVLTVDSENYAASSHSQNYNAIDEEIDHGDLEDYVISEDFYKKIKKERPFGDKNYPVIYDTEAHTYSPALQRLREQARARQAC